MMRILSIKSRQNSCFAKKATEMTLPTWSCRMLSLQNVTQLVVGSWLVILCRLPTTSITQDKLLMPTLLKYLCLLPKLAGRRTTRLFWMIVLLVVLLAVASGILSCPRARMADRLHMQHALPATQLLWPQTLPQSALRAAPAKLAPVLFPPAARNNLSYIKKRALLFGELFLSLLRTG